MQSPIVEISHLEKSYSSKPVLLDACLAMQPGQIVGLVGRNGAGKTTLLETIMGLREPDAGTIKIWQNSTSQLSQQQRESIGFVAQEKIGFEWMKVKQYLEYFGSFYSHWQAEYANQLSSRWQLDSNSRIADLSGGQQQILQVIHALSIKPKLLVLDEPVAHLDPNMRRQFLAELIDLTCEIGTTVLFSTHIISDLERVASHVALLNQGKIQHYHELEELKNCAANLLFSANINVQDESLAHLTNWREVNDGFKASLVSPDGPAKKDIEKKLGISIESFPLSLEDWYLEVTHAANK